MDWNLEKENLERLILTDKVSYEEIGRMYGCTGSNIRRVATLEDGRKVKKLACVELVPFLNTLGTISWISMNVRWVG